MTKTAVKPETPAEIKAEAKAKEEFVSLTVVQNKNLQTIQQQEQVINQQAQEIRVRKMDLFELILDAKGFDSEKLKAITRVELLDNSMLKVEFDWDKSKEPAGSNQTE